MAADEVLVSPEDLEGATVVSAPKGKRAPSAVRLSAEDLEGAEVVTAPARATRDVHEMARAESRQSQGPRALTDEEAGTLSHPITALSAFTANDRRPVTGRGPYRLDQPPAPADAPPSDYTIARPLPGGGTSLVVSRGNPNEMADPLAQMGTATALGMVTGTGARGLVGAIPRVGEAIAPTAGMAAEGSAANKAMGGDLDTGAALGLLPLVPKVARGAARVVEPSGRTLIKDIAKGTTKAPARLANEVKFKAGDDGGTLAEVIHEVPEVRKAIMTRAKTDPGGAAGVLSKHIDDATAANDEAFAAMQREHKGVALAPVLERLDGVAERLRQQGRAVSARAVRRVRAMWEEEFGGDLAERKLAGEQRIAAKAAADKTAAMLREKAAAARASADELLAKATPPDRDLLSEARKIDAPQGEEPSLFERAREIDAPVSRKAAADVGRERVAERSAHERATSDAAAAEARAAEATAIRLERRAARAEKKAARLSAEPVDLSNIRLSANQVRNMRNDIGEAMDPARTIKPNTKRQAEAKIHAVLNKEIEDVAAQTRGVDVDALRKRNRQISTLIPVRDALAARAESEADMGVIARAKKAPANAVRRGLREVREGVTNLGKAKLEAPAGATSAATSAARAEPTTNSTAGTKLSPEQERRYQQWRARLPKELQYEGDYDLRGFFLKNPTFAATSGQHMTDEFKLPNHPTFSNESRYYNERTKHLGGHWEGDVYIPNDTRFKQRVDESVPTS